VSRVLLALIALVATIGVVVAYKDPEQVARASDTVSELLRKRATSRAVQIARGEKIDFMEAVTHRGIDMVSAVREASAAFMAEAAAMTGGGVGVCLSTLGPGSTAVLNGVAAATLDRVPVLAVSGQIESSREQFFTHQVVDHGRMFAPATKLALRLDPASADTVIRKALRTAVAERPGAVHLTVVADAWAVPVPGPAAVVPPPLAPAAAVRARARVRSSTSWRRKATAPAGSAAKRLASSAETGSITIFVVGKRAAISQASPTLPCAVST